MKEQVKEVKDVEVKEDVLESVVNELKKNVNNMMRILREREGKRCH